MTAALAGLLAALIAPVPPAAAAAAGEQADAAWIPDAQQSLTLDQSAAAVEPAGTGDALTPAAAAKHEGMDPSLLPPTPEVQVPGYGRKIAYYNEPLTLFDREQPVSALDDFPMAPAVGYRLSENVEVGMVSLNAVAIGASWQLGPSLSVIACFTRGVGTAAPELRRELNREIGFPLLPETESQPFERARQTTIGVGLDWRF